MISNMVRRVVSIVILMMTFYPLKAQFTYEMIHLEVLDTIFDKGAIEKLRKEQLHYLTPDYFTVGVYKKSGGLCLITREGNHWLAVSLPADNSMENRKLQYNGRYIYYETFSTHASRGISGSNGTFNLIDPVRKTYVEVPVTANLETYDTDSEDATGQEISCRSKVILQNDELHVVNFSSGNSDCIQSGVYKIEDRELKKIKHLDESRYAMVDVRWAGKIATYMNLDEIINAYGYATVEPVTDSYSNCAAGEVIAHQITWGNDTLAVVLLNTDDLQLVRTIIVLSDKIPFGKVHKGLSAKELFQLYPKAKLRADLLSDDEYVYLEDLKIKVVFKTTESNRVGKYDDEEYKGLKRPDAVIDFIEVN
jgi:hypothetical protein